jgi:hypothetical protein
VLIVAGIDPRVTVVVCKFTVPTAADDCLAARTR